MTPTISSPLSKKRVKTWLKLLKATRNIEEELRRRFRSKFDTTLPRFDAMAALNRFPEGLKMSEISQWLRVSNGNITGIVDKLADAGLAERVPVPGDRRAYRVQLTKKGTREFVKLAAAHEQWIDELLGELNTKEMESLNKQLDQLTDGRQ